MNAVAPVSDVVPTRRRFTVAECERMAESGVLHSRERIELVDGELIEMSPKGIQHEVVKEWLLRTWLKIAPDHLRIIPETTFRVSADSYFEPDILIYRRDTGLADLNGSTVLLIVEIADSSLAYDRDVKPGLYAQHGVREYWVIDALRLTIHVHRHPEGRRYGSIMTLSQHETAIPASAPELPLRLADLKLSD